MPQSVNLMEALQMTQELMMNCQQGLLGAQPDLLLDTIVIETIYQVCR